MYIYIYKYIHTYIHSYLHTNIHIYIYTYIHIKKSTQSHKYKHKHPHITATNIHQTTHESKFKQRYIIKPLYILIHLQQRLKSKGAKADKYIQIN